jgi:pilus assembly protein Flp/PilA
MGITGLGGLGFNDNYFLKTKTTYQGGFEMKKLISFFKDEEGATAVEYALMVFLIAVVIIGIVTTLGTTIKGVFQSVVTAMGS